MTFNRLSHKKTIQSLTSRVAFLESLLVKHKIEIPPEGATESHLSTFESQLNSLKNDLGKDEAAASYTAHPDLGRHSSLPEFSSARRLVKSDLPLVMINEWGNLQRDHVDVTDPFHYLAGSWELVYDFDRPHTGGQGTMQPGRQVPMQEFNDVQSKSNAAAGDNAAPYGASTMPNLCAQRDDEYIEYFSVGESILKSTDRLEQRSLPTDGQSDCSKPEVCVPPDSYPTDHDSPSDDNEIMDQLSARMGSFQIAEDGQLRYFGATSNLHILQNGLPSFSPVPSRSIRAKGEEALSRAGLGQKVNEDVERHLEDLYFRWEDPAIHVVDEETYFLEKSAYYSGQDERPFYSETLKNAMQVKAQKNT